MKKHLLKLSLGLILGGLLFTVSIQSTNSYSAGGTRISGYSGSPYDGGPSGSCTGCHSTNKGYVNWIRTNIPATGYIPGTTYTITCVGTCTTSSHNSNFGFEFTPQNQTSGAVIGTLANITTSGTGATQIATSEWVTHTSSSYTGTDSNKWSFKWTAPNPGVGAVPFYAVFNCGSGDNQSSGWIFFDSTHVKQASTVGVQTIKSNSVNDITIYPNPVKDHFNISYTLQSPGNVEINLYSLDGRKISTLQYAEEQVIGDYTKQIQMPMISAGIYLVQIVQGEQSSCKKIIVQ